MVRQMRRPVRRSRRPTARNALVPVVALGAGLLFATSAAVSGGTDLRSAGSQGLVGLVRTAQRQVSAGEDQVRGLDAQIKARTDEAANGNAGVSGDRNRAASLQPAAGFTAVKGPGLMVALDDSHQPVPDPSIDPNELVVHQSDLQAVVNSLWAGGAEAMSIAGQRLIVTSAVRCVGNTLLLNGRVYSPPFRVVAIGPAGAMRQALGRSTGVRNLRQAADVLGLTYTVTDERLVTVPAYDGPAVLNSAHVPGSR